jgi:hypothetical protein
MTDDNPLLRSPNGQTGKTGAPVTDLATRRGRKDVLHSITVVFGGVHYGTIILDAPYAQGKPMALYVVPARDADATNELAGPLDCLITDDASLVRRSQVRAKSAQR